MNRVEPFGMTPDGKKVERVAISGGGLKACFISYGSTLQDLRIEGVDHPLVLGSDRLESYFGPLQYFGATVGRFANRIRGGKFLIDGQEIKLDRNYLGKHCLHGGSVGTSNMVWNILDQQDNSVAFGLILPDGYMGFPGKLEAKVSYTLTDQFSLDVEVSAVTDAPTPCSFVHDSYFNLDGSESVDGHVLQVEAGAYLPTDEENIPTGEIRELAQTDIDFRCARVIANADLDNAFCLRPIDNGMKRAATLFSPQSGLALNLKTTKPGLQVYNAAHLPSDGVQGLGDRTYRPGAGLALEAQEWPDAPNQSNFPNSILRPNEIYLQKDRYSFHRVDNGELSEIRAQTRFS